MVLRLMPCSPRRRIRLVTVIGGLRRSEARSGSLHLRRLDTSNGCQDHTFLPFASAPFVSAPADRSRDTPALRLPSRDDTARVHRIPPDVRDDRETPLVRAGQRDYDSDLRKEKSGIFFRKGLDSDVRNERDVLPVGLRAASPMQVRSPDPVANVAAYPQPAFFSRCSGRSGMPSTPRVSSVNFTSSSITSTTRS